MKRVILLLLLGLAALPARCEPQWYTDLATAQEVARRENKNLMLDFTGSDWCGWCIKLHDEVFSQPEFVQFARANLVLVEVDFPRHKSLSVGQREANEGLAEKYHIQGFPTCILLDTNGRVLGQTGYTPGGPAAFDASVAAILKTAGRSPVTLAAAPVAKPGKFTPPASTISNYYGALVLKGISGTKDRRMALINNATLMTGEIATVKVQSRKVEVVCKEIREDSVLITVDGKPMELILNTH